MANIVIKRSFNANAPITVEALSGFLFTQENQAHVFEIDGISSGSATGYFIAPDGTTKTCAGTVSGGKATVTLSQDCYNDPGRFKFAIMNSSGGVTTCIYAAVGNVYRTKDGEIYDSGEVVPSLNELLGYISACQQATTAAREVIDGSVRFDISQTLTDAQKAQARANIEAASTTEVEDLRSALNATIAGVDGITIERYTKTHDAVAGTIKNNYMYDRRGYESALNNWAYLTVSVQPDHAYLVSGTASTNARLYTILDSNGDVIALADSDNTVRKDNVRCVTPSNASTLIVNANTRQGQPSVEDATSKYTYDGEYSAPIAVETAPNTYTISGGDYETIVELYGTPNGTVKMNTLNHSGTTFKALTDDVTPVNFDAANYVGANHGYEFGVKMTISEHGLTTANIGTVYSDVSTGYDWLLLYIVDANNVMACALSTARWYGMANVSLTSMPSTVDFGTGSLTISSTTKTAIFPSVKNISISVVENNAEHFAISETYDIINPSTGIAWIQNHIGSCGNTSFAQHSDSLVTVRNLYDYDAFGNCVISQNLITVTSAELDFYGGTQSMRFGTSDCFAVLGTSYNKLTSIGSSAIYFSRDDTWGQTTVPPICYIQSDGGVGGYTKLFISIIFMNERNALLKTNAGFYHTTRKMYPYAIEIDNTVSERTGYGIISVRIPVYAGSDAYCFRAFSVKGKDYGFFAKRTSGLVHITMPEKLLGKSVAVLANSNCRILADTVVSVFDVYATDEAYMLMEFE